MMLVNADIGWSWVNAGNSFAAIAGLLAAFNISAIVLLLSRPPGDPSEGDSFASDGPSKASQHLFYAFLVSLYSFVMSALLFANVTGAQQKEGASSFFMGMFAGTILAIAAMQLLLAIIWTALEYDFGVSLKGAKVLFAIIAVLAASIITIDYGDYCEAISKSGIYWAVAYPWLPVGGALLMFFLPLLIGLGARHRTWRKRRSKTQPDREADLRDAAYGLHDIALWVSVGATTVLILFANTLGDFPPDAVAAIFPPWMSLAPMALVGVCIGFFIWSLPYKDPVIKLFGEKTKQTSARRRKPPDSTDMRGEAAVQASGQARSFGNPAC